MSRRSITLEMIRLTDPPGNEKTESIYFGPHRHFLEVEVHYSEGGANYFSGTTNNPRGYFVSATPVYLQATKDRPGHDSKGFLLFSGKKLFVMPAKRFSEKALATAAEKAKTLPDYENLKLAVLDKNKLTVAES